MMGVAWEGQRWVKWGKMNSLNLGVLGAPGTTLKNSEDWPRLGIFPFPQPDYNGKGVFIRNAGSIY